MVQSVDEDTKLPRKKMKTMFLSNMSKSRRLTTTFFPDEELISVQFYRSFFHRWYPYCDVKTLPLAQDSPSNSRNKKRVKNR